MNWSAIAVLFIILGLTFAMASFDAESTGDVERMVKASNGWKFDVLCIEGHEYYKRTVGGYKGIGMIRLDDEGKPVKCGIKP